jgi:mono/diheme cytochrome c family protein
MTNTKVQPLLLTGFFRAARVSKRLVRLLAGLFFVSLAVAQTGNSDNGKKLFVKVGCYQCHGYDGHGGFGAKLAPKPIALPAFLAYVRHPGPGNMPIYTPKVLPDADLTDIWAYLRSIPDPPPVKDVPLLNNIK